MPEFWIFLSSGLFLGWSLGANDGSNVFGTAVGTRMVKFRTRRSFLQYSSLSARYLPAAAQPKH